MSAFACDPVQAGEPYVGWNWMGVLAQFSDVTVLTRSYHREAAWHLNTRPMLILCSSICLSVQR